LEFDSVVKKSEVESEDDPVVTAATLASRVGASTRTVGNLATRGIAVRGPGGRGFRLWASIRNYFQELRSASASRTTISDDRKLLLRAQTAKIEFENSIANGTHANTSVMLSRFAESLQRLRGSMLAIPDRIASHLGHLTRRDIAEIDAEIRAAIVDSVEAEKATLDREDKAERDGKDETNGETK
jgi:phage terminase Nu1 subunit (DNA packaging protein)